MSEEAPVLVAHLEHVTAGRDFIGCRHVNQQVQHWHSVKIIESSSSELISLFSSH